MPNPALPRIDPSATDLAWAAGIVDGEGCIYIGKRSRERPGSTRPGWKCTLRVANTDVRMVNRMWQFFGGHVTPPRMIRLSTRPYFEWHSESARSTRAILEALLPYLVVKRDQAEVAIQFANTMWKGGRGSILLPDSVIQDREEMIADILRLRTSHEEAV